MWNRRDFLKGAGSAFVAELGLNATKALAKNEQFFAATCKFSNGKYGFVVLGERGDIIAQRQLPTRGHDLVQCPKTGNVVVFARRPGLFAAMFDVNGKVLAQINSIPGRHFYGHGVFHPTGKWFYATENDFENARGIIGIYAVGGKQIARIGEIDANGVGPHDIQLSADGHHLIIANGGIETHPDYARTKLNLPTMRPNISWLDIKDGTLIASFEPPHNWHNLSLRHLSAAHNDEIWVGGQFQGTPTAKIPLIARVSPEKGLEFISLPPKINQTLNGYVGSIELSRDGQRLMAASPKGNQLLVLDMNGNVQAQYRQDDICALAPSGKHNMQFGTGLGQFGQFDGPQTRINEIHFDNHMIDLNRIVT